MSLVLNDLAVVLDELHDVRKMWYEIGLRLQLPVEDLETISSEHKNDQQSLRRVILLWLKSGTATWAKLCDALSNRTVGEMTLADKLRGRYSGKGSKERNSAKKTRSEPCPQETSKCSTSRPEPEPECGRKLSDLSVDKSSTVDSLDDDVAIIDVGSPSCEQYRAADKATPLSGENKKRGLDTPVVQSESKRAKRSTRVPESFSQDDFSKAQPSDRQCVRCERIPHSPMRDDCCNSLYCKPCSRKNKVCKQHEEDVEFSPDNKLRVRIRKLTMKCLNRERGCTWKGRMGQLNQHLAECGDSLLSETAATTSDTEDNNMAKDDSSSSLVDHSLASSDCVDRTPVSKTLERKAIEPLDITVADIMGGVEMGSEFNSESGELGCGNAGTNGLTPPLNLIMKSVSKYQLSKDEIWSSLSFSSHQLGYKLCLTAKVLPQPDAKLSDSIHLEVSVVSAQDRQDSFLKFPCIGDAKVKLLNPHQNTAHREISMGFMIHNERRTAHTPELTYPMVVPKEFIFKDRLFFHVVAVQLSEDHRPWLLDPGQVAEDVACSSDSESECNVVS